MGCDGVLTGRPPPVPSCCPGDRDAEGGGAVNPPPPCVTGGGVGGGGRWGWGWYRRSHGDGAAGCESLRRGAGGGRGGPRGHVSHLPPGVEVWGLPESRAGPGGPALAARGGPGSRSDPGAVFSPWTLRVRADLRPPPSPSWSAGGPPEGPPEGPVEHSNTSGTKHS